MLRKVKFLNYGREHAYAPPQEDAVLNTDEIVTAVPAEARGSGPFVRVNFKDGTSMTVVGTVDDLLPKDAKEEDVEYPR